VDVFTKLPSLTFFNPITPSNGALISVLSICALTNSISALTTLNSFKDTS
jgi:hypothetical protein